MGCILAMIPVQYPEEDPGWILDLVVRVHLIPCPEGRLAYFWAFNNPIYDHPLFRGKSPRFQWGADERKRDSIELQLQTHAANDPCEVDREARWRSMVLPGQGSQGTGKPLAPLDGSGHLRRDRIVSPRLERPGAAEIFLGVSYKKPADDRQDAGQEDRPSLDRPRRGD
jgi:hypothetical protein